MKVTQYISGKFHYIKYTRFLENKVDLTFVYSGKPGERFCTNEKNYWYFYTILQALVKILPDKCFNLALRTSYAFWRLSLWNHVRTNKDSQIYHFLCHGFSGDILKKYKRNAILLGHVVNAHPRIQNDLIENSKRSSGIKHTPDKNREHVDNKIVSEVEICDYVLSPSHFVTKSYVDMGFPAKKFITLNYGLEKKLPSKKIACDMAVNKKSPINIICVGQIIPRKGQHLLVSALEDLAQNGYTFNLTLIGRAETNYLSVIKNTKIQIKHINHIPNKDLVRSLPTYDLFVLPSYEDGFAVAVTEAISAGLPVVVSSAVGAADLLKHKNNSVFEVGNVESLKEKIQFYLEGKYMEELSDSYDWEEYSERLKKIYSELTEICCPSTKDTK